MNAELEIGFAAHPVLYTCGCVGLYLLIGIVTAGIFARINDEDDAETVAIIALVWPLVALIGGAYGLLHVIGRSAIYLLRRRN